MADAVELRAGTITRACHGVWQIPCACDICKDAGQMQLFSARYTCSQAVGDKLIDSIVSENIPVLTTEEKFNETVLSSVERVKAALGGGAPPVIYARPAVLKAAALLGVPPHCLALKLPAGTTHMATLAP